MFKQRFKIHLSICATFDPACHLQAIVSDRQASGALQQQKLIGRPPSMDIFDDVHSLEQQHIQEGRADGLR